MKDFTREKDISNANFVQKLLQEDIIKLTMKDYTHEKNPINACKNCAKTFPSKAISRHERMKETTKKKPKRDFDPQE